MQMEEKRPQGTEDILLYDQHNHISEGSRTEWYIMNVYLIILIRDWMQYLSLFTIFLFHIIHVDRNWGAIDVSLLTQKNQYGN